MTIQLFSFLNQFMPLSEDDFARLIAEAEAVKVEKKTRLTDMGQVEQYMYFIVEGLARKFFYKGKQEVITHIVKEGGIIGSSASFLSGKPSAYIVETLEPSFMYRMHKEKLEALYQSHKKWEKFGRIITGHFFLLQEYRLLDNLRYSNKERFIRFMNDNPDLLMRVPQKYLASYLNIRPETFSRLKHVLMDNKKK